MSGYRQEADEMSRDGEIHDNTAHPSSLPHQAPSSPTVANTDAFIKSKKQQSFSSQLAAELS